MGQCNVDHESFPTFHVGALFGFSAGRVAIHNWPVLILNAPSRVVFVG